MQHGAPAAGQAGGDIFLPVVQIQDLAATAAGLPLDHFIDFCGRASSRPARRKAHSRRNWRRTGSGRGYGARPVRWCWKKSRSRTPAARNAACSADHRLDLAENVRKGPAKLLRPAVVARGRADAFVKLRGVDGRRFRIDADSGEVQSNCRISASVRRVRRRMRREAML